MSVSKLKIKYYIKNIDENQYIDVYWELNSYKISTWK